MMENSKNTLLIAFYGDDFTGATDALAFLSNAGINTMLFIEVPNEMQLSRYPDLQAIGIAGMSRAMTPDEMEETLFPAFEKLAALKPKHVHYKVCSTFDSSPTIGNIGKAIEIGMKVFKPSFVPVLAAAPALGRYMLFGNLFARMGIGSEGEIYRLDRHPSMSKHPTTPADESDIRLHLGKQTKKSIGLFNILALNQYEAQQQKVGFKQEIVLFDAIEEKDLTTIGEIIDGKADENGMLFSVGSSGIEMALGAFWQQRKSFSAKQNWETAKVSAPIVVLSGSCSAITSTQINFALHNGFVPIAIDTIAFAEQISSSDLTENSLFLHQTAEMYALQAINLFNQDKQVIIHTSLGNDDERVIKTAHLFAEKHFNKSATAKLYGTLLGLIAKIVASKTTLNRIIVAGGDTASYAARAMEIEAVEMIAPLSPGAPLCKAYAPNSALNNLQIAFKGGQVGKEDFFISAANDIQRNQN